MFKNKKFRLHVSRQHHLDLGYPAPKREFKLSAFLKFFGRKASSFFFTVRSSFSRVNRPFSGILTFLLIALASWAFLQSARFTAVVFKVKEKILINVGGGANSLQEAKRAMEAQDLGTASKRLAMALGNFEQGQKELNDLEQGLLGLNRLLPQGRDGQKLLTASIKLAQAGETGIKFLESLKEVSFGSQGLREQANFDKLASQLDDFDNKLTATLKNLKAVDLNRLPEEQKKFIELNQKKLELVLDSTQILKQLMTLGQTFFTGRQRVLLLLQNNNELRTTGGFIGSFGEMDLANGKIENLNLASIYALDGQLNEKILPPAPLLAVNDRWFLRDANWFISFNQSAKKIISFYEKEGGETPDLVAALTPSLIADLLKITGPLKIDDNLEINDENLVERLQVLTQSSQTDPSNEPKKILSGLFAQLFQKIGGLKTEQKTQILESLQKSLSNKQMLFYSNNSRAQKIFEEFNWAGESASTDRDYLQIASSNLGGTKTDYFIEQNIRLESEIKPDGEIENVLTIVRANNLPQLAGTENKSFIRIYVPKGSVFREASGFDPLDLPKPPNSADYKTDPDVFKLEKSSVRDLTSGTVIGEEAGKAFFGNWVILKGGQSRKLTVKYSLPFKLKNLDHQSLLVQKQPGSLNSKFEYALNYRGRKLDWKNFSPNSKESSSLSIQDELNEDRFFGMVLSNE